MTPKMWISAVTCFIIAGGGSIGIVAASGNKLNSTVYVLALVVGLISAAKDVRSQLALPAVGDVALPKAVDSAKTEAQSPKP